MGMFQHVGNNQGEEGGRLAGARGHFQQTMTLCIQCFFKFTHIGILLRIYVIVGEINY